MSAQPYRIPLNTKALAAQAAAVERLRAKLATARDQKLPLNSQLVAHYAQAQRAFIEAKIEIQRLQQMGTFAEEPFDEPSFLECLELEINPPPEPEPEPVVEVVATPAGEAPVAAQTSPATHRGSWLRSRWGAVLLAAAVLATSLFWLLHGTSAMP